MLFNRKMCQILIPIAGILTANMASAATVTRESVSSVGVEANASTTFSATSSDGRYVAFASDATNLVSNDTNGSADIFLRDRVTGTTTRISVGPNGVEANGGSAKPSISADGRYVAYESGASNLVAGDTNGTTDVFVYDALNAVTVRASMAYNGLQTDGASVQAVISGDGKTLTFNSVATNLVSGDTNARIDTFARNLVTGATDRVSVSSSGAQGNNLTRVEDASAISYDGRYVAFRSSATNLVSGDTNGAPDIFVRDRVNKTTKRVSVTNTGSQGTGWSYTPSISSDGRYVAFRSDASNLVTGDTNGFGDIFVRDTTGNTTKRISVTNTGAQADNYSSAPSISGDGRYVAFTSAAANLVAGDTNAVNDIFVRDITGATTIRASVSSAGVQGNGYSGAPVISANGAAVVFSSGSDNLVFGDTNSQWDIFVFVK